MAHIEVKINRTTEIDADCAFCQPVHNPPTSQTLTKDGQSLVYVLEGVRGSLRPYPEQLE